MARRIGYARSTLDDLYVRVQAGDLELAGCTEVFCDPLLADEDEARTAWMAFLSTLEPGDTLVVSRIELLAHTMSELREKLLSLEESKVHLDICHWLPAPPMQPGALSEVVQRLADFESVNKRELTRLGVQAARVEGRIGGRRHKLKPEQIRELQRQLRESGADPVEVGRRFGVSRATAFRYKITPVKD